MSAPHTKKANRLALETSTYLKQHAYNPVDWYPWGEEALQKAQEEDKPILLSVGYAACHWCHVMEHESFEDEATAQIMNEHFVNIKVDREERTDIDEIYMKAVQLMTGHGGWPMTVFLNSDLQPFFGGTYFPNEDRHGLPSFKKILMAVASGWQNNREQFRENCDELTRHLKLLEEIKQQPHTQTQTDKPSSRIEISAKAPAIIEAAVKRLIANFDAKDGGFGGAPKFPHTQSLELALRVAQTNSPYEKKLKDECLEVVTTTLNKMAMGGIQDQLAGGFARYSTDKKWLVPHFEKMLYDNALLAKSYFEAHLLTGTRYWQTVGEEVLLFAMQELGTEYGAFYSSLDADSEGVEGKYYVFTAQEIEEILGKQDGKFFREVFGVTQNGNFEHGSSVLHLTGLPEELAERYNTSLDKLFERIDSLKEKVLQARKVRIKPGRDEKILTSWNALMISAFVAGYKVTANDVYLMVAKRCAQFILDKLKKGDKLLRVFGTTTSGENIAKLNGCLDDYAYFAEALLELASVDEDPQWLSCAHELAQSIEKYFYSEDDSGFYYTGIDHEKLIVRPRSHFDSSVPSGTSVACMVLLKLARLLNKPKLEERALQVLSLYLEHLAKRPEQFANLLNCLEFAASRPKQIVAVLPDKEDLSAEDRQLMLTASRKYAPNKVMLTVKAGGNEKYEALLSGKEAIKNKSTIYLCHNYSCQAPIQDLNQLKEALLNW
jgi:uncharacterized protein YyaL (SSP411 family)